jgi:glycine betaine/choline ABC-type transport system substrate-binding protein
MLAEHPEIGPALDLLGNKISDEEMRHLNYEVDGKKRDVKEVVREFLRSNNLN